MSADEVRQRAPIDKQITRLGLGLTGLLLGLFALLMVLHEVNNRRTDVEAGLTSLAGMIASGSEAPLLAHSASTQAYSIQEAGHH